MAKLMKEANNLIAKEKKPLTNEGMLKALNEIYSKVNHGVGNVITLPANITSVLAVQMRMIAATAYMAGYDIASDQVQTLIYACLAGVSVAEIIKKAGIQFGVKFTKNLVQKIPGKVLTKINQKVGMRFLTKFGTKGVINIGKMIPVVGAVIGGSIDLAETSIIGKRAMKMFFDGDLYVGTEVTEDEDEIEVIDQEQDAT